MDVGSIGVVVRDTAIREQFRATGEDKYGEEAARVNGGPQYARVHSGAVTPGEKGASYPTVRAAEV